MIATVFRSFSAMLSILFLTCAAAAGPETIAPSPVSLPAPPDPPVVPLPPEFQQAPRAAKAFATGDFGALDLSDRQLSAAFYRSVFTASENTEIDWTGEVGSCMPGDTSDGFKDAVLTRVNWYRAMAGVPDTVVFQTGAGSYSEKAQDAALIMSSNNLLSHSPNSSLA